ncbi:hypothetical protein [uncultured Nostoc sp.]
MTFCSLRIFPALIPEGKLSDVELEFKRSLSASRKEENWKTAMSTTGYA